MIFKIYVKMPPLTVSAYLERLFGQQEPIEEAFCHCINLQEITFRETADLQHYEISNIETYYWGFAAGRAGGESFGGAPIIIYLELYLNPFHSECAAHDLIWRRLPYNKNLYIK